MAAIAALARLAATEAKRNEEVDRQAADPLPDANHEESKLARRVEKPYSWCLDARTLWGINGHVLAVISIVPGCTYWKQAREKTYSWATWFISRTLDPLQTLRASWPICSNRGSSTINSTRSAWSCFVSSCTSAGTIDDPSSSGRLSSRGQQLANSNWCSDCRFKLLPNPCTPCHVSRSQALVLRKTLELWREVPDCALQKWCCRVDITQNHPRKLQWCDHI